MTKSVIESYKCRAGDVSNCLYQLNNIVLRCACAAITADTPDEGWRYVSRIVDIFDSSSILDRCHLLSLSVSSGGKKLRGLAIDMVRGRGEMNALF